MRVLFSSLPAHGHTYPLIPLAVAARAAGHEVLYATGQSFKDHVAAFGLDVVPAGITIFEGFLAANGGPIDRQNLTEDRLAYLQVETFGATLARAFFDDLGPVIERAKPDLVVHETGNAGAFFAAKRAGIPGVCHGFGKVEGIVVAMNRRRADFGAEIGVPYAVEPAQGGGDPYLDVYPPSMQNAEFVAAPYRIPIRPVPVSEPRELPAGVAGRESDRPLVFLTLGTGFGTVPVLKQVIAGLSSLDVDVLVAAGPAVDAGALGAVPDNVRIEEWVAQAKLLPHVDAVVHHGGSGTTLGALAFGLPQLVLPQGADQFLNAAAVEATGAGHQILPAALSAESVRGTFQSLLVDAAIRARAEEVRAEIAAMPSPAETVPFLVERAGQR